MNLDNIPVYIFGSPHGFDLYNGNPNDINYFQTYDDGSKETSKLTANRRSDGQIVYSYLCYKNMITSGGRGAAFFGMSVKFNEICTDFTNLYKLFEQVYKTILQEGVLLRQAGNQPVFSVSVFKDAEKENNRIIAILQKNIKNEFADDFIKLDNSFKWDKDKLDKVIMLNNKYENENILKAFKDYPTVSISLEYKDPTISENITEKQLNQLRIDRKNLDERYKIFNDNLQNDEYKVTAAIPEINGLLENYNSLLKIPLKYLKSQNDHPFLKNCYEHFTNIITTLKNYKDLIQPAGDVMISNSGNSDKNHGKNIKKRKRWWKRFSNKYSTFIAVAGVLVIIMISVLFFEHKIDNMSFGGSSSEPTPVPAPINEDSIDLVTQGNDALNKNEFDIAVEKYTESGNMDLVNDAKSKAVAYNLDKSTDTDDPKEILKYLEIAYKYPDYAKKINPNIEKDIDEVKKQLNRVNKPSKPTPAPISPKSKLHIEVSKDGQVFTDYNVKIGDVCNVHVTGNVGGHWNSSNPDVLKVKLADTGNATITIKFHKEGTASAIFTDADGTTEFVTFSVTKNEKKPADAFGND